MRQPRRLKLIAVDQSTAEGGYSRWVEEITAPISEGDALEQAEAHLQQAPALVLERQPELSDPNRSPPTSNQSSLVHGVPRLTDTSDL